MRKAIQILGIEPKLILTRSSKINPHVVIVEANHLNEDGECYFILNSTDRASLNHLFG